MIEERKGTLIVCDVGYIEISSLSTFKIATALLNTIGEQFGRHLEIHRTLESVRAEQGKKEDQR